MAQTPPNYPHLANDIAEIEKYESSRRKLSETATQIKQRFQYTQLIVIGLSALVVVIGAIQASQSSTFLTVLQIIISIAVGILTLLNRELKWQQQWLKRRAASETYKREYYRFLSRMGEYATSANPAQTLRQNIRKINRDVGFHAEL